MSDMKVQIKISAEVEKANKGLETTKDTLQEAADSAEKLSDSLDEAGKSASDSGESLKEASDEAGNLADKKDGIDNLQKSLASLSTSAKKLGRDLSTYVTAPLAAIAGLSLKNLYDSGSIAQSSGVARDFALSVQSLKENFRQLTLEIGAQLAPAMIKISNLFNNLIKYYRELSPESKRLITIFAGIAAAVGPLILGISAITGLFSKLLPLLKIIGIAFSSIGSALVSIPAIIIGVATAVAGLVNVFSKLKSAGVDTAEAIKMTFKLMVGFIGDKVVGTLTGIVSKALSLIGTALNKVKSGAGDMFKDASKALDGFKAGLEQGFQETKSTVDSKLAEVGSSAAEAFTYGFSSKLEGAKDWLSGLFNAQTASKLESEMGKSFDEAFRTVEAKKKAHDLAMEMAEFEHQQRMLEIDTTNDPEALLNMRLEKEREFLDRKHQLEKEDWARSIELEEQRVSAIRDKNERNFAEKELRDKRTLEATELNQRQELEIIEFNNKEIEKSYETRYSKAAQYANMFSSGLSSAFVDIADGTKDLGSALDDFAKNFIKQVTQMIMQAMILKAVTKGMAGFGFAEGGPVGGARKLASGGFVSGPGSGTSDSIPAWLSNGEYVIKASAVRKLGVGFLNGLNGVSSGSSFSRPKHNGFAEGGLVTSPSSSVQVAIENKGSEKQVIESSYDPATAVVTVVLDDISKNGPVSKAMQNTFGVRRGGFR